MHHDFLGRRVLMVEDNYLVATALAQEFEAANAVVVGPFAGLADAAGVAATSQMAVLDVVLRGEQVFPLADMLLRQGVPFLFFTGSDRTRLPERFADIAVVSKPSAPQVAVRTLGAQIRPPEPPTITEMLPALRLRAWQLVGERSAGDRLLEMTLKRALESQDSLTARIAVAPWLEDLMLLTYRETGSRLLH
jgi:DNA-binding response OmpR family regulator